MKNRISPAGRAALSLAAAFPFCALAQTSPPTPALKETVVTATRTQSRADELVSEVVVVGREEIERSGGRTLPEVLARSAGLQFASNGGLGKFASVFIRGTEARHTILMIDGVRYGSATNGTPIWDNIPLDMVERIEVLKGPASSLYGSEGVGGVVQIFTRKGSPGLHLQAAATLGSSNYSQASAGIYGGTGAWTYALGVQHTDDKGFSSTNPRVPFGNFNPDKDPFRQDALNASATLQINSEWKVDAGLLNSEGVSHYDDGPGRDTRAAVRTMTARLGVEGKVLPGWTTQLRYGQSADTTDAIVAGFLPSDFKTSQTQWTWQNDVNTRWGKVLIGAEQLKQKVTGSTAYTVSERTIDSWFAGISGSQGPHSWQLNGRRDTNSQFGGATTGFTGYGFRISPAWRVNASYGTSFVAPSFNQLYFPGFGNAALQPEHGRNLDLGATWTGGAHTVKIVRYDNRIRGFISGIILPTNIPRARIEGWTLGYDSSFGALTVRAALDALDPRNELTGKKLPRRSSSQLTLGADYTVGPWAFGGNLLHVGDRFDDTANTVPLSGYTTIDLYTDYTLSPQWKVQGRINNVTNKQYETVLGYNQPGRALFATLRYTPK